MWRNESSTEMESWKEGRRGGAGERTHARGSILEGNTALPHSCLAMTCLVRSRRRLDVRPGIACSRRIL